MANFQTQQTQRRLGAAPSVSVPNIDVRTGAAEVSQSVVGLGLAIKQIYQKRQEMTDDNSVVEAQTLRDLADEEYKQYKANNPQETWEKFRREQTRKVAEQVDGLPFSSRARERERAKSKFYGDVSTAGALTDSTYQLRIDTIEAQTESLTGAFRYEGKGRKPSLEKLESLMSSIKSESSYEEILSLIENSGDPVRTAEATKRYISNGPNMGKDKNEVLSDIKAAKAAGEKLRNEDAVTSKRNEASINPVGIKEQMDAERKLRSEGESTPELASLTNEDLVDIAKFATTVDKEQTARRKTVADIAIGAAVADWSAIIADPTKELSSAEVWSTEIVVPPEFEKEVGAKKQFWANVANGITDRKLKIQSGKDKKIREESYDPELVAELKTAARNAVTPQEVKAIKEQAAVALSGSEETESDRIDDDDLEDINVSAEKSFDTSFDKAFDARDKELRTIMLQGTSDESLVPWLQAQVLALPPGEVVTAEFSTKLIKNFRFAAKSKTWASNQARREVELALEKTEKEESVADMREMYLQTEKTWLRKTDETIIEEYTTWLSKKP